jgi:hypothetical protein
MALLAIRRKSYAEYEVWGYQMLCTHVFSRHAISQKLIFALSQKSQSRTPVKRPKPGLS